MRGGRTLPTKQSFPLCDEIASGVATPSQWRKNNIIRQALSRLIKTRKYSLKIVRNLELRNVLRTVLILILKREFDRMRRFALVASQRVIANSKPKLKLKSLRSFRNSRLEDNNWVIFLVYWHSLSNMINYNNRQ